MLYLYRGVLATVATFRNTNKFVKRLMNHDAAVFKVESDFVFLSQ